MFRNFGPLEIGLILLIVIMIFGVGKLPEVGSAIGKSIRAFRQHSKAGLDEEEEEAPQVRKHKVAKKQALAA